MKSGFLTLETHSGHNELVRVEIQDRQPEVRTKEDGSVIRYIARFRDIDAARMHVQNAMHNSLVDVENRIYRKSLASMIACVEADELDHQRTWIDPAIDETELSYIEALTDRNRRRHRWIDLLWQAVGALALLILILSGLIL